MVIKKLNMNFELPQQGSSGKNIFENEKNVIEGTVDFIMSAKVENDGAEEGWTEGAGRIGFAQMFLEDFTASKEIKEKILERVKELVANEQQENKERMAGTMGIIGQEGQRKTRKEEDEWRRQHGA